MWTPQFMSVEFAARVKVPTHLTTGLGVAQVVGNPLGALAMGCWGKWKVIAGSPLAMTVCIAAVLLVRGLRLVFVFVTLVGFFTTSCVGSISAGVAEVVRSPAGVGAATGLLEVFGFTGALAAPWLFGFLLDTVEGSGGYLLGYLLLAGIAAVGSLRLFFLKLPRQ